MALQINKAWKPLNAENLKLVRGQLGVYELGCDGDVLFIGYAGGKSLFGLRGELEAALATLAIKDKLDFRLEVTMAYHTRYRELLMLYFAVHGHYPPNNPLSELPRLGRLSPAKV